MNNTINHVSDQSVYKIFNPANTQWPASVVNVQQALALVGSWARTDVGLPVASQTVSGIAMQATNAEVTAGTNTTKFVTPAQLKANITTPQASQTTYGFTRYATNAETLVTTNDATTLTPRGANYLFNNRPATESVRGTAIVATTAQALAGTDNTTMMTPLKVKQQVATLIPVQSDATESVRGLVRLATVAQVQAGTIREGYGISPYTFNRLTATESAFGISKIATQAEVNAGTENTKYVTALKLQQMKGSGNQFGVVKLSTTLSTNGNTALSSNAAVLPSDRNGVMSSGDLYKGSVTPANKYQTYTDTLINMPIGAVVMAAFTGDSGRFAVCNGRLMDAAAYPELFAVIGYTWGGSNGSFNLPDMRGLVPRGWDNGRGEDAGRQFASYQQDATQQLVGSFVVDDQSVTNNGCAPDGIFTVDRSRRYSYDADSSGSRYGYRMVFDSSIQGRVADQTRVKSLALNFLIRVS